MQSPLKSHYLNTVTNLYLFFMYLAVIARYWAGIGPAPLLLLLLLLRLLLLLLLWRRASVVVNNTRVSYELTMLGEWDAWCDWRRADRRGEERAQHQPNTLLLQQGTWKTNINWWLHLKSEILTVTAFDCMLNNRDCIWLHAKLRWLHSKAY